MFTGGSGQKVTPHGLRVCVIKDWDSRWKQASQRPADLGTLEKYNIPGVIGKIREWNNQGNKGMKNVPRKKPHHR